MLCLNCGREIEFNGNVCPWCGAPKMQSQRVSIFSLLYGLGGAFIGVGLGVTVNEEFGWLIGGFIGMVIGVIAGYSKGST